MIRHPRPEETALLQELWARCFADTQEERDWYFQNLYQPQEILADFEDRVPVAMLQMLPTALSAGNKTCPAAYLYGVCTHPDHRRQGRMRALLETAHQTLREQGVAYAFLKPEDPAVYQPFGYVMTGFLQVWEGAYEAVEGSFCDDPDWSVLDGLYRKAAAHFPHASLRSESWWKKAIAGSGHARLLLREGMPVAYAIYGDGMVDELIAPDTEAEIALLGSISHGRNITVRKPVSTGQGYAMTKVLDTAPPLEGHGCFGLLFD